MPVASGITHDMLCNLMTWSSIVGNRETLLLQFVLFLIFLFSVSCQLFMKYNGILFGKSKFDAGNVFSSMLICFLSLLSEMMQKQSIMLLLLMETFDRR
jgi:hypothetical protein